MDTEQIVEQWTPLIHSIIRHKFPWVATDTGTKAHRKIRRAVDYDDLMQEGYIGLIEAANTYNENHASSASFKTWAYSIIYLKLVDYVDRNSTPITVPRSDAGPTTPKNQERLRAAKNYLNFSDGIPNQEMREQTFIPMPPKDDTELDDPAITLEEQDFSAHCLRKLQNHLETLEYDLLILHYAGETLDEIGQEIGVSGPWVKKQLDEIKMKCLAILHSERRLTN